jgi:hypothetical protein
MTYPQLQWIGVVASNIMRTTTKPISILIKSLISGDLTTDEIFEGKKQKFTTIKVGSALDALGSVRKPIPKPTEILRAEKGKGSYRRRPKHRRPYEG